MLSERFLVAGFLKFNQSPLSVLPRFSESLSVNHLSFKLWFLGLFFGRKQCLESKLNKDFIESQVFSESRSSFFCVFVISRKFSFSADFKLFNFSFV